MNSVRGWLEELRLGDYAEVFEANRIDAEVLPHLTEQDLVDLGLPIGPRRKLMMAIRALIEKRPVERSGSTPIVAPPVAPERRHLTVMFCDLVGSTALSEALDAEDLRNLMQAYQQAAGAVIARYQGHVAQYLGDGLMIYFGWPAAHEDDAERAVRAGLEIVDAVKAVTAPAFLRVRIGIASGPVVVGETGAGDASVPKLAVGETPNLAARVQALAGPDELVVAASTRRLIGAAFELDPLGEQPVKGIAQPVAAWRVTGIAPTEGRFEAVHSGRLTPFVGREAEVALMLQRWRQAKDGEGQVLLLCGEPGIGKSRITEVLREQVAQEPHTRLRVGFHHRARPGFGGIRTRRPAQGNVARNPASAGPSRASGHAGRTITARSSARVDAAGVAAACAMRAGLPRALLHAAQRLLRRAGMLRHRADFHGRRSRPAAGDPG